MAVGTFTWRLYAIDVAGNNGDAGASDWTLVIDTTKPSVLSVAPTTLADADVGPVTITITFDEDMDQGINPTVTVEDLASSSYVTSNPSWTDATHFTCQFAFVDDGEDTIGHYHISGAQDLAGNMMDPDNTNAVDVDTENPTITSITSTTADGYYNVGASINVTVGFSEPVILSGGTLDVTLDTPADVVSIAPFGPGTSATTTYTVGMGDNSCDLDATGILLNGGTLRDEAGNDAVIALPATTIADGSDITVDTTGPVIDGPTVSDKIVDTNCQATVTFSATVTDNCCVDPGDVTVTVTLTSGDATLGVPTITKTQNGQNQVGITGSVPVFDLNGCPATVQVTIDAIDCCGNNAIQASDTGDVTDTSIPVISGLTVSDETVDANCEATVTFSATVTDNCCVTPGAVTVDVTLPSGNATLGTPVINKVQNGQGQVDVSGSVLVSDLTGCPATVEVTIDATDCCGNDAVQVSDTGDITDTSIPVINDLTVSNENVDGCCEATVNFTADVTDNCCIRPDSVTVTVSLPTNNAILENIVVNRVQNGQGRVDITGSADVRCLTSCPARVEVRIEATDCCGNNAAPVTSTATEGRVYDETVPEPNDDPNGDEDRSASDNLEVRSDDYGQHRLMVREDTPVRIDVVYNDSDNCSCINHDPCVACSGCDGTLWIFDIVDPPKYGTATREDDERSSRGDSTSIRYAPYHGYYGTDEFTYRIVDACGNVSSVATVYIEVVAQTVMDDLYLTTCVDTAVSFDVKTTDLWVDPDNPDEIPFVFSIVTPPMHGVISGDLGDVTYAAHGGIESATITLVYTPAAGFVGRDALTLRFADPFGGSSTALVDIAVIECAGQPGAPPPFVLQQGEVLPLIVPLTFASVYETAWYSVTLIAVADGTAYQGALSATWEESIGRYVLRLDTSLLPPGLYRMTIPLGNGETVTLTIEVSEAI